MIKIKLLEILNKKGRSKYWIRKNMNITSNRDLNDLITGKNKSISYSTLNKLCIILECKIEDILEFIPDKYN